MVEEISSEDLEQLEDALEQVAEKQMELKLEQQELAALKEDVQEYQEVSSNINNNALFIHLQSSGTAAPFTGVYTH